jgi:hypothetical protein
MHESHDVVESTDKKNEAKANKTGKEQKWEIHQKKL